MDIKLAVVVVPVSDAPDGPDRHAALMVHKRVGTGLQS